MAIAENEAPESSTSDLFPRGGAILSLIAVSIGIIFFLDAVTPLGVPVWVLYLIPLILTYQAPVTWIPYLTVALNRFNRSVSPMAAINSASKTVRAAAER